MSPCPEENVLVQFAHGLLAGEALGTFAAHLDGCESCRRIVAAVARAGTVGQAEDRTVLSPPVHGRAPPLRPEGELTRGAAIGRYVVLERLGAGGMGVVYAAYDPQLDRRVALKLVRGAGGGGSSPEGRSRLVREAQTMARLSHPNVVAVHDAGPFGDQIFLAMELVSGQDLKAWLAEAARPWRQVLDVYLAAGRGLEAAHAAGLVHRDFKPENVLLAEDGRVRVTDFGLARQLDSAETPLALSDSLQEPLESLSETLTRTGVLVGTPAYMAPEQAARSRADARSDQFSYCVSLYEALYGERPFKGATLRELIEAAQSGRVQPAPAGSEVPVWIRKVLLRGLSFQPDQRYPSMAALLEALQRDPAAQGRRLVLAGAAGAALVVAVVGAVRLSTAATAACRGAEAKLAGTWDDAQRSAARKAFAAHKAEDAWDRVRPVLDAYATTWSALYTEACEATSVRREQSEQVLDLRMRCLQRRLSELRAAVDVMASADLKVTQNAFKLAGGLSELSGCMDVDRLLAEPGGPTDPALRQRAEAVRAHLAKVKALEDSVHYEQAREEGEKALAEAAEVGDAPVIGAAHLQLGRLFLLMGEFPRGLGHTEDAAVFAQGGQDRFLAARAWVQLASTLALRQQKLEEARRWLRYARAALRAPPRDPAAEAQVDGAEAVILQSEGRLPEAEVLFQRAIRIMGSSLGERSYRVSLLLNNLLVNHIRAGKFEEGIEVAERALSIRREMFGPDHPALAQALSNLAVCYSGVGRHAQAVEAMDKALAIKVARLGPDSSELMWNYHDACLVHGAARQFEEALRLCDKAVSVSVATFGAEHGNTSDMLGMLGETQRLQGDCGRATTTLQKAIAIKVKALGADHPEVGEQHRVLGLCQLEGKEPEKARVSLERAVEAYKKMGVQTAEAASAQLALARALNALGRESEKARELAESAAKIYEARGAQHADEAKQARALARP